MAMAMSTAAAIPLWPGVPVGEDGAPSLTPYLVERERATGGVIVCPGGGYGGRAPHEGEPVARWLNVLGLSAFVLHYRVAPHRHPIPLRDAQRALRLVRSRAQEWRVRPDALAILGFSAGGHLAATAATHFDAGDPNTADPIERQSCRPDALVLCYAVLTFGEHRHHGSMLNLLGDAPAAELRRSLSAELRVTPATPPTFLWHTADDAAVPAENALLFASALAAKDVPFALHVFPHGRHGLGLAVDDPTVGAWTGLCAAWLRSLGW